MRILKSIKPEHENTREQKQHEDVKVIDFSFGPLTLLVLLVEFASNPNVVLFGLRDDVASLLKAGSGNSGAHSKEKTTFIPLPQQHTKHEVLLQQSRRPVHEQSFEYAWISLLERCFPAGIY
jgi:hypothetical protein